MAIINNIFHLCSVASVFWDPMDRSTQAPASMGFSRRELPVPSPGGLPNSGAELVSLRSPALAGRVFTASAIFHLAISYYSLFQMISTNFLLVTLGY